MKARATKSALTTRESTSRDSWRFCSHQTPGPSAQVTNSVARCLYEDFIYPLSQSITASCALNQPPFTRTTIRRCYQLAEERREILSFAAARGQAPLAGLWEDSNACLHEGIHIHGDRSCPPQQTQACRRAHQHQHRLLQPGPCRASGKRLSYSFLVLLLQSSFAA